MNSIEKFIADKRPSPKQAQKLRQYFQDIEGFFIKMAVLPLSALNALQIGEWIEEIAKRRGADNKTVIEELLGSAVFSKKGNGIEAIKHRLKELRFPEISRIEGELKSKVHELELPRQVSVEFPKDLEGDKIIFHLAVRSSHEFKTVIDMLLQVSEDKLQTLFSYL